MSDFSSYPFLLVSDESGNIFEISELRMTGMANMSLTLPEPGECIPLPEGSDVFVLPGRTAFGFDPSTENFTEIEFYNGRRVYPVAAFMAPAYLQYYRAAYAQTPESPPLTLFSYTAVGFKDGEFVVPAERIDPDIRQDWEYVDLHEIERRAPMVLEQYPDNRLVDHLINNCALCYGCPAARNFVMGRWECPVPTSPGCNAECVGCISKQPEDSGFPPAQNRIGFVPTPEEIAAFTVPHLDNAENPVMSFGQGCEGEPLLVADTIAEAVKKVRKRTNRGVININTNGGDPEAVENLCGAGMESLRVSMNSAQPDLYHAYYRPLDYGFDEVLESIRIAGSHGLWVSLNYFVFPGLTDHQSEMEALDRILAEGNVDMIQTRNLNLDPFVYISSLGLEDLGTGFIGVRNWANRLRDEHPSVRLGYFNPPRQVIEENR